MAETTETTNTEEQQTISVPSYNPADAQELAGVFDFFQKSMFMKIEKVAPAQVVSVNGNNRCTVQILNFSITSTGEKIARKPIADIPIAVFGASGFGLKFPVKQGDIGLLIASDGDISIFKKLQQTFTPATYQKHKYKDGVFFPLLFNGLTANIGADSVVLSTVDGTSYIELKNGEIVLNAAKVTVNGELTANSAKILNGATGSFDVTTATNGIVTGGS